MSPQKRHVERSNDDDDDADGKQRHDNDGDDIAADLDNVDGNDRQKLLSRVVIGDKFDWEMTEPCGPEQPERSGRGRRLLCCPDPTSVYVVPNDQQLVKNILKIFP